MTARNRELSARERQIMDVIYRLDEATVAEVRAEIPEPPSYSTVRALLRILEDKGHVNHREDGRRYVYLPTVPRRRAQASALQRLLDTFFAGSRTRAVAALLDLDSDNLTTDELDELASLVREARSEGR